MIDLLTAVALWGGINSGMTQAQAVAAKPEVASNSWVAITPDCPAKVKVHYRAGLVERVELRGKPAIANGCANRLRDEALVKFGEPLERVRLPDMGWRYGLRNDALRWASDGVLVTFKRLEGSTMGEPSWTMEFKAVESPF